MQDVSNFTLVWSTDAKHKTSDTKKKLSVLKLYLIVLISKIMGSFGFGFDILKTGDIEKKLVLNWSGLYSSAAWRHHFPIASKKSSFSTLKNSIS